MTNPPATSWQALAEKTRDRLVWWLWLVVWLLLLARLFDRAAYHWVVLFSALHVALFIGLFGLRISPFPVQVRLAYLLWVALGAYVPYLLVLMHITTIGLAANLFWGYCPLARLMSLMPWNRSEPLSGDLLRRTFFSPPSAGRFVPPRGP